MPLGGEVTYSIKVDNTGNIILLDYTVTMKGNDIGSVDIPPGEFRIITRSEAYVFDTTESFSYYYYVYKANKVREKISTSIKEDVHITVNNDSTATQRPIPSGAPSAAPTAAANTGQGLVMTLAADPASAKAGEEVALTIRVQNTGSEEFIDVSIINDGGNPIGGWAELGAGETKEFVQLVYPNETTTYRFGIRAEDRSFNVHETGTQEVQVVVAGTVPTEPVQTDEPVDEELAALAAEKAAAGQTEEAEQETGEEPRDAEEGGIDWTWIIVGIVVIFVLAVLLGFIITRVVKTRAGSR